MKLNKMKNQGRVCIRRLSIFLILSVTGSLSFLSAQESILGSYQQNFIRANLAMKAGIIRDAATDERAPEFIGQLCEFALNFTLQNAEILRDDPEMMALVGTAAREAGKAGYKSSADTLWTVFSSYPDPFSRVEILKALALLGKGNARIVENINQYLENQNRLFRSGLSPDYPSLSACIWALAQLGDSSSFPALFAAFTSGYPNNLSQEALRALDSLSGDYKQFLIDVIRNNPPPDKLAAFNAGANSGRFSPGEQGQIAESALEQSLVFSSGNPEEAAAMTALRYASVLIIGRLQWTGAASLVIRHFYRVQTDYQGGNAPRERFMEAVSCLASMGSSEAAQALALQLGLINAQTEKTGTFDTAVVLAHVEALGAIGDKSAFDHLLYISYLPYPDHIQAAAREALTRLKW
jgi:HEAT repeat protein